MTGTALAAGPHRPAHRPVVAGALPRAEQREWRECLRSATGDHVFAGGADDLAWREMTHRQRANAKIYEQSGIFRDEARGGFRTANRQARESALSVW